MAINSTTDISQMFSDSPFNGDISNWDMSNVTDMGGMFENSSSFNQDLSSWDVSNVTSCNSFQVVQMLGITYAKF